MIQIVVICCVAFSAGCGSGYRDGVRNLEVWCWSLWVEGGGGRYRKTEYFMEVKIYLFKCFFTENKLFSGINVFATERLMPLPCVFCWTHIAPISPQQLVQCLCLSGNHSEFLNTVTLSYSKTYTGPLSSLGKTIVTFHDIKNVNITSFTVASWMMEYYHIAQKYRFW